MRVSSDPADLVFLELFNQQLAVQFVFDDEALDACAVAVASGNCFIPAVNMNVVHLFITNNSV